MSSFTFQNKGETKSLLSVGVNWHGEAGLVDGVCVCACRGGGGGGNSDTET